VGNEEQFESVMLNASIKAVLASLDMVESARDFEVDSDGNLTCTFIGKDKDENQRMFTVVENGRGNWEGNEL
jgi:hypothetical protein